MYEISYAASIIERQRVADLERSLERRRRWAQSLPPKQRGCGILSRCIARLGARGAMSARAGAIA